MQCSNTKYRYVFVYVCIFDIQRFSKVGISVPIVQDAKGNEMGYRPLEIDDLELEQICTDIDVAESDKERLKHFKPMQDLFRRVNIANDECDYGMGLEFGISLFAHGSKYFHKMILKGMTDTVRYNR